MGQSRACIGRLDGVGTNLYLQVGGAFSLGKSKFFVDMNTYPVEHSSQRPLWYY